MDQKTAVEAIIEGRCPCCRSGRMFTKGAYNFRYLGTMEERCSVCDFKFEKEPGFWYGAMFLSYAISVVIFLSCSMLLYFLWDPETWVYIVTVLVASILLFPINFSYSRILYLHILGGVKFQPDRVKKEKVRR